MSRSLRSWILLYLALAAGLGLSSCGEGDPVASLSGSFAAGTTVRTLGTGDHPVTVRFWYPASGPGTPAALPVTSEAVALGMEQIMGFPRWANDTTKPSRSWPEAPAAPGTARWPVILFDHGTWSFATQNLTLMESLASQGYLVGALSHPGESLDQGPDLARHKAEMDRAAQNLNGYQTRWAAAVAAFAAATTPAEARQAAQALEADPVYQTFGDRLPSRTSDLAAVVAGLEGLEADPLLGGRFDQANLGLMGHSLGGITAVRFALAHPDRVKAVVNLDGPSLPATGSEFLAVPSLFLASTATVYGDKKISHEGMNRFWRATARAPLWDLTVDGAAHLSFTDLTYTPALKLMGMTGSVDGLVAGAGIQVRVEAFFARWLRGTGTGLVADEGPFRSVTSP